MEYSELLELLDSLPPPVLFGRELSRCDEEFLQLHADFIVIQVRSWEGAEDDEEDWTMSGMPCIRHISDMAGVDRASSGRGRRRRNRDWVARATPQPEVHVKAVTTPLVCRLFESTFQQQMVESSGMNAAAVGNKMCTCRGCQNYNCGKCIKCRSMVSFGGDKEDNSVICMERMCTMSGVITLEEEVEEVELEEEDEDGDVVGINSWVKIVRWSDPGLEVGGGMCYNSAVLQVEANMEVSISCGDFLLVKPDREEDQSVAHYPCQVVHLVEKQEKKMGHVRWMARGKDTVLGNTADPWELFLTRECEDILLTDVSKVLNVHHRPVEDVAQWKSQGGTEEAITIPGVSTMGS